MTQNLDARLNPHAPAVVSLFRVIFGLGFLNHAVSHLFGWPAAAGPAAPMGSWPYWWAGLLELIASVLITVGLFTRIAAFLASGIMAFAYFTQHLPAGFPPIVSGELAVLYCFAFFLLVFTGGGLYALDSRVGGRRRVVTGQATRRGWRRR